MVVYHICSVKKFLKYMETRVIKAPVRAWKTIQDAERFSKQTSRVIILRLKFPDNPEELEGHRRKAVILHKDYPIKNWLWSKGVK